MPEQRYKVILQDNNEFFIESEILKKSPILENMFMDPFTRQYRHSVTLPNMDTSTFSYILAFIREIVEFDNDADIKNVANKLIATMDSTTLIDIIHASHTLNIKPLLEVAGAKFKHIIQHNDVEDIRRIFNIKNDFNPEEEQQIINNFQWK